MNYVVECRNKVSLETNPNQPNGLFTTNIQDKIMLEEGDTIVMKSAFIDTEASSQQKIIIDEDLVLELTWVNYVMNDISLGDTAKAWWNWDGDNEWGANLDLYIMTKQITPAVAEYYETKPFTMSVASTVNNAEYGGFFVYFNYTDVNGDKVSNKLFIQKQTVDVYNTNAGVGSPKSPEYNFNAVFDKRQPVNITAFSPSNDGAGGNGFIMATDVGLISGQGHKLTYNNSYITEYPTSAGFPIGAVWGKLLYDSSSSGAPVQDGISMFVPQKFTKEITITEGNYEPKDLCEEINRQLVVIGDDTTPTNIIDNDFLRSNIIQTINGEGTGTITPDSANNIFVNPIDGRPTTTSQELEAINGLFVLNTQGTGAAGSLRHGSAYIGASQVEISFDTNTQRFSWEYLHMPVYRGGNESVVFGNLEVLGTRTIKPLTRHGGIIFTDLSAKNANTGVIDSGFWSKTLGFNLNRDDPNCLLGQYSLELNYDKVYAPLPVGDQGRQFFKPVFNPPLKEAIQLTGGYMGIDKGVLKNSSDASATFQEDPNTVIHYSTSYAFSPVLSNLLETGELYSFQYATVLKTTPIEAGENILQGSLKMSYGYYLIEVQSNFQNNFITPDENRKNVMGIISRYYVNDSYTSATEDASMIYTHHGEPMLLSSFTIRILDSNKNLATNIGQDNTLFLNIIKQTMSLDLKKTT